MRCGGVRKRETWGFDVIIAGPGLRSPSARELRDREGRASWGKSGGLVGPSPARRSSNSLFSEPSGTTPRSASWASPTREGPGLDLAWISSGARSPPRPRSSPGLSPPCPLGRRGAPQVIGARHPRQSFPAFKCGFWSLRKWRPCP